MRRFLFTLLFLSVVTGVGAGGYWLGRRNLDPAPPSATGAATSGTSPPAEAAPNRKILFYRAPMGGPDTSPVPKKDSMGMDYIPVYEGDDDGIPSQGKAAAAAAQGQTAAAAPGQPNGAPKDKGKILYYRNAMGLPDTSPVPKKDAMGMDYIPVYRGEEGNSDGTVKISLDKVQKLGVQSAPAELRDLSRTIHAVGTVQADERRLFVVNTKFDGWIETLHVDATGQSVRRGEPLMEVYSPELVVAQQDYLLAWRSFQDMAHASDDARASAKELADAALQRLRYWDISNDQIKRLQQTGTLTRTLTVRSPANGVVMEKAAIQGMRFTAGEPLYRIADLSTVWLIADVFEQDLGEVHPGENVQVTVNAYPGQTFTGKVDFIYPTVSQDTRTGKVRIVIPNADGRLKTEMYANVALDASVGAGRVLTIPESAVINSGTRQTVLVERGEGRYEPREVKLGAHADGYYAVLAGLDPGEKVVVSANFLIDAESNLKTALEAFAPPETAAQPPQATPAPADKKAAEETR